MFVYDHSSVVPLFVLQGYQGMVDGGESIQLAEWKTVSGIIQKVRRFMELYLLAYLIDA